MVSTQLLLPYIFVKESDSSSVSIVKQETSNNSTQNLNNSGDLKEENHELLQTENSVTGSDASTKEEGITSSEAFVNNANSMLSLFSLYGSYDLFNAFQNEGRLKTENLDFTIDIDYDFLSNTIEDVSSALQNYDGPKNEGSLNQITSDDDVHNNMITIYDALCLLSGI